MKRLSKKRNETADEPHVAVNNHPPKKKPMSSSHLATDEAEHHAADVELYLVLAVERQHPPAAGATLLVLHHVPGRRHFLSLLRE